MLHFVPEPAVPDATADRKPPVAMEQLFVPPAAVPAKARRGRKRTHLPAILRAATRVFAEHGFDQPTMDQVATAAGVRKATLYNYFDGKSALIEAVIERWLRGMPATVPEIRSASLRSQLLEIGWQLQKLSPHPAAVSLAKRLDEMGHRLTPPQRQAWQRRYAALESHLAALLERHCDCDHSACVAHQFVLLCASDWDAAPPQLHIDTGKRIERAVDLLMRAYPEKHATPAAASS